MDCPRCEKISKHERAMMIYLEHNNDDQQWAHGVSELEMLRKVPMGKFKIQFDLHSTLLKHCNDFTFRRWRLNCSITFRNVNNKHTAAMRQHRYTKIAFLLF
jgi:hypothetical protein